MNSVGGVDLEPERERLAKRLHESSIVIDGGSLVQYNTEHIAAARRGGVTAVNHHIYPAYDFESVLRDLTACRRWIAAHGDDVVLVTSARDIEDAKTTHREAIIFGPQNSEYLGSDLDRVWVVRELGLRITQMTYQRQNLAGSGCGEERDSGLTHFGRELVRELDGAGIVIDLAHAGNETAAETIAAAEGSVIISHGHPNSMSPHIRAFRDDVLLALAAKGGVIGVTGCSQFLYDPSAPSRRPDLRRFIEHIRYLIDLIGIDHVGIGLDLDEEVTKKEWDNWPFPALTGGWPYEQRRCDGLESVSTLGNVTRALVWAGLDANEIGKILGGNFLRVYRQVWQG